MQSNAIDELKMISEKTNFLQNWSMSRQTMPKPKFNSFSIPCQQLCKQSRQEVSCQFAKLKNHKSQLMNKAKNSVIMLDSSIKFKDQQEIRSKAPTIKHKQYHKNIASSMIKNRYHKHQNITNCNTINLYEYAASKKTSQNGQNFGFDQNTFSNNKIVASFQQKNKHPVIKQQQSGINRKKILNCYNRYFYSALINTYKTKKKYEVSLNNHTTEASLRATKLKMNYQNRKDFVVNFRRKMKSLDIL